MTWSPDVRPALERAKQEILERYGDDPAITGAGVGIRQRGGTLTDEPVVVVGVVRKRPEGSVSRRRLLPKTVEVDGREWGVDVIETGRFRALAARPRAGRALAPVPLAPPVPLIFPDRVRPPRLGCSISNLPDVTSAGTYGCTVRDLRDGTMCLLSCSHVIARMNTGSPGELIVQPGEADGGGAGDRIATLKRFAFIHPVIGTDTDAAIAQLDDQANATNAVLRNLMAPISPTHPAVGLAVARSSTGWCFLTEIGTVLNALEVELAGAAGGSPAWRQAEPGMRIEKVGRTSGYTSSIVQAVGFGPVTVDTGTQFGMLPYFDLILTWNLVCPGDSGAVACVGGNGTTHADCEPDGCPVLGVASEYYDLPLSGDDDLTDSIRDDVLSLSPVGWLLITAIYQNTDRVISRLQGRQGTSTEVAFAQQFYTRYHDFVAALLADPSSDAVVTQEHLNDLNFIIFGLSQTLLTTEEEAAANALYEMAQGMLGMNRQQVIAQMNDPAVFLDVYASIVAVPGLDMTEDVRLL